MTELSGDALEKAREKINEPREQLNRLVDSEIQRLGKVNVPINRIIVLKRILYIYRDEPEDNIFMENLVKYEIMEEFKKEIANDFS